MLKIASLCLLGVICLAIFVMHIICAFVSTIGEKRQRHLEYVNIAFHILLLVPLFLLGFSIEIAVLFFMASVFLHTLLGAIAVKLHKAEEPSQEPASDEVSAETAESDAQNNGEVGV